MKSNVKLYRFGMHLSAAGADCRKPLRLGFHLAGLRADPFEVFARLGGVRDELLEIGDR